MIRMLIAATALLAAQEAVAQTAAAAGSEKDRRELGEIFRQIDLDRNGRVTKVEMAAFGQKHSLGVLVSNDGWRALDENRDGVVSEPEFTRQMIAWRDERIARQPR